MEPHDIVLSNSLIRRQANSLTLSEMLEIGYRRRRTFGACFLAIFLGAIAAAIFLPRLYESELKILAHRERMDPIVTAQANAAMEQNIPSLTEEDINSEVAILRSEDLLEKVVVACGLDKAKKESWFESLVAKFVPSKQQDEQTAIRQAAIKLNKDLRIEPVKKSFIITLSYSARDPQAAAHVLNTLANLYLEKHADVYRPKGAFAFFDREAEQYRQNLEAAESRLAEFDQREGVVAEASEKDAEAPKLAEFELSMRQAEAAIPQAEEHVRSLEALLQKTPARITTQLHTADNGGLMQQLRSNLVNLEAQRTDLTTKYAPGDRMVKEVDAQIAQVRAAIDAQEKTPLREETTDQSSTYEFLRQELAKAKAELAAQRALAASSQRVDKSYQQAVIERDHKQLQQQALLREVKAAEANYQLYQSKREEARISEAFDQNRILNVSIAQAATVPLLPSNPVALILILGWLAACLLGTGVVLVQERLSPSLRSPEQIEGYLDAPILASVSNQGRELSDSPAR
jgi:uncharacterized protein involved in exopolysaccharide biosynthesis